jgi:hypothetical protein
MLIPHVRGELWSIPSSFVLRLLGSKRQPEPSLINPGCPCYDTPLKS